MPREKSFFYIGTLTEWLYVAELDVEKREVSILDKIKSPRCPSYQCLSEDRRTLYTTNENKGGSGGVSAYDITHPINPRLLSTISTDTGEQCHVSLSNDQKHLLSAEYSRGRVYVYPIKADGSLSECSCMMQLEEGIALQEGMVEARQGNPHAHCVFQVPGTQYVLTADLGTDRIYVFRLVNGQLAAHNFVPIHPGTGARHFSLHPSGRTLYLIGELGNTITVLDFDRKSGVLTPIRYVSTLPEGYKGDSWCSAIHISRDGRFLYGSNREQNSIAVFSVSEDGKELVPVGYPSERITWPWDFSLDPSGKFMVVANKTSHSVCLYRVCPESGMLEFTGSSVEIDQPTCIKFI